MPDLPPLPSLDTPHPDDVRDKTGAFRRREVVGRKGILDSQRAILHLMDAYGDAPDPEHAESIVRGVIDQLLFQMRVAEGWYEQLNYERGSD